MNEIMLYRDELIKLTENSITFYNYFPLFKKERTVLFNQIKKIDVLEPTLLNGKYRLSGTGNFKDWFPADYGRSRRDKIFRITLKNKYWRIGFTVEDSNKLVEILKSVKLI